MAVNTPICSDETRHSWFCEQSCITWHALTLATHTLASRQVWSRPKEVNSRGGSAEARGEGREPRTRCAEMDVDVDADTGKAR